MEPDGGGTDPAEREPEAVKLALMVDGLTKPVDLVPLSVPGGTGDEAFLIVQQNGLILRWIDGDVASTPLLDLRDRVSRGNEQGLLSAVVPPGDDPDTLYVSYTDRRGDSILAAYPFHATRTESLDPDEGRILFRQEQPYANHNGGLIRFGPDGALYLGLGDGGSAGDPHGYGQNPNSYLGSLLRFDVSAGQGDDAPLEPTVWAYGLRNPWRFSFDHATGDLYIADVGQNRREEINRQPASRRGVNYGWNAYEGSERYAGGADPASEVVFPIIEYPTGEAGCAVTGGHVYRGRAVAGLAGDYVFGDYCAGTIWRARERADGTWQVATLLRSDARISSFGQDLLGELYVLDLQGRIFKLVPANAE